MSHVDKWRLRWIAQLVVVLLCALLLKLFYSTASANELRWILAPTTVLVELLSGMSFEFEPYAGYINSDRSFLIAVSCSGINFFMTSFLMLSLRRLWTDRSRNIHWRFMPTAALVAYAATLVANTVRISIALQMQAAHIEISWLNSNQLHRLEGVFVYFGSLLLLFLISERIRSKDHSGLFRLALFPLVLYYAAMLGIPLANGANRQRPDFWEHALFVLLVPLVLLLLVQASRIFNVRQRLMPENYGKS